MLSRRGVCALLATPVVLVGLALLASSASAAAPAFVQVAAKEIASGTTNHMQFCPRRIDDYWRENWLERV